MNNRKEMEQSAERNRQLRWAGILLKRKRLEKGWSQESVCRGICAVSTLSKIESGSATGSEEILNLLAEKLSLTLSVFSEENRKQEKEIFELLEAGRFHGAALRLEEMQKKRDQEQLLPDLTWTLLIGLLSEDSSWKLLEDTLDIMDNRERILYGLLKRDYDLILMFHPEAWVLLLCMSEMYRNRAPEYQVLEMGSRAYQRAAEDGELLLMGEISTYQAAVCSNILDFSSSFKYMKRAEKIYTMLEEWEFLDELYYNMACTLMQAGRFQEAMDCFEKICSQNTGMILNKMAICYEQLLEPEKALDLLKRARSAENDGWSDEMMERMLEVTRIRLERKDWLHDAEYGEKLLSLYEALQEQEQVHKGFAQFYLPWMIQWLKASRQYARLAEIMEDFSKICLFEPVKGQSEL